MVSQATASESASPGDDADNIVAEANKADNNVAVIRFMFYTGLQK